jgi:hypothetical protein
VKARLNNDESTEKDRTMPTINQLEITHNGLVFQIDVTYFSPARSAPHASTPDCPGYDDPGDPGEVEFDVTGVSIDCEQTFIESFSLGYDDEELCDLVYQGMDSDEV